MVIALLAIAIGATILSGLMTIYIDVPRQMRAQFRNYGANMIFTATEESISETDVEEALRVIEECREAFRKANAREKEKKE